MKALQPKLNIITLGVTDVATSTAFYNTVFGWEPTSDSNENITFYKLNGILLSLYNKEKLAEDVQVPPVGSGFTGVTLAHVANTEEEVDEIFAHMETHGVKILKAPEKVFWGGYSGYILDLDGHHWEIAYNPFMNQDTEGNVL